MSEIDMWSSTRYEVVQMKIRYGVILAGTVISFVSAVVPHYTAGYQLLLGVLVAGIIPYLIYAMIAVLFERGLTDVVGVVLLTLHLGLVINERFVAARDYTDSTIYVAPLVFAVLLIPLLIRALREPWRQ